MCVYIYICVLTDPVVYFSHSQNEYMDGFLIKIETWHKNDMGDQENVSHVIWHSYLKLPGLTSEMLPSIFICATLIISAL